MAAGNLRPSAELRRLLALLPTYEPSERPKGTVHYTWCSDRVTSVDQYNSTIAQLQRLGFQKARSLNKADDVLSIVVDGAQLVDSCGTSVLCTFTKGVGEKVGQFEYKVVVTATKDFKFPERKLDQSAMRQVHALIKKHDTQPDQKVASIINATDLGVLRQLAPNKKFWTSKDIAAFRKADGA